VREQSAGDHEEIRQLAYRYAEAVDSRDLAALVALFVVDVRVGRQASGRDALAAWFDPVLRTFGVSIHFVGNHRITLDGDTATGVVYCRAEHEVDDRWVVMMIQYWDTYARRDGEWFFVRRKEKVWYGADVLERPAGPRKHRWPGHEPAVADLPGEWPSWGQFWSGGPGTDPVDR
jgi:ketosteroid isomerase-like protein